MRTLRTAITAALVLALFFPIWGVTCAIEAWKKRKLGADYEGPLED